MQEIQEEWIKDIEEVDTQLVLGLIQDRFVMKHEREEQHKEVTAFYENCGQSCQSR